MSLALCHGLGTDAQNMESVLNKSMSFGQTAHPDNIQITFERQSWATSSVKEVIGSSWGSLLGKEFGGWLLSVDMWRKHSKQMHVQRAFFLIPQNHRLLMSPSAPQALLYPVGHLNLSEKELFWLSWVQNLIKRKGTEPENWRYLRPERARENTVRERGMQRGSRGPKTGPLSGTIGTRRLCVQNTMCPQRCVMRQP